MGKQINIRGKVQIGERRGKLLGFPTANLRNTKIIEEGVYISSVKVSGKLYEALTFIGAPRTFNVNKSRVEAYIFDFNKDIYGKWLSIFLIRKIRNNIKFQNIDELINQMKSDETIARNFFASYSNSK